MCSFCLLLALEDDIYYWRGMERKPAFPEPRCHEGHFQWLLNVMKKKKSIQNAAMSTEKNGVGWDGERSHEVQQQRVEDPECCLF